MKSKCICYKRLPLFYEQMDNSDNFIIDDYKQSVMSDMQVGNHCKPIGKSNMRIENCHILLEKYDK